MKDYKKLIKDSFALTLLLMVVVCVVLALGTLIVGCNSRERIVYERQVDSVLVEHIDTLVREVEVLSIDTIKLRDSVFIERINTITLNEAGDTIYRDRIVFRDRWHDAKIEHIDSHDSSTSKSESEKSQVVSKESTVTPEKSESVADKIKNVLSIIGAAAIIGGIIWLLTLFKKK